MTSRFSRRTILKGAGTSLAMLGLPNALGQQGSLAPEASPATQTPADTLQEQTRAQRMQWWHAARFGMFVHFGVYSSIQRH